MRHRLSGLALGIAWVAAGCGDEVGPGGPFELVGVYANSFNQEVVITEAQWGSFEIRGYDNFANRMVFEAELERGEPPIFGRIVWTERDARGAFYYCFEVSSASTLAVARDAAARADATDPANGGCGDFPWARAWRAVDIRGTYETEPGVQHTVTATVWRRPDVELDIVAWENPREYLVARNPPDADSNPDRYRLVEWTSAEVDGAWFVCDVREDYPTAEAAYTSSIAADRRDPATGGCGGAPWHRLNPLP